MRSFAPVAVSVPSPSFVSVTAKVFLVKVALTLEASLTVNCLESRISLPLAVRAVSS